MSSNISLTHSSGQGRFQPDCFDYCKFAVCNAGLYTLAAYTFTIVTPSVAAVYGAASGLVHRGLQAFLAPNHPFTDCIDKCAFIFATRGGVASILTKMIGVPITFT